MRCLILAAGKGMRLRPLTETVPKCLVPIQGRPLLEHWCDLLLGCQAVERILVNTSWLSEKVVEHVRRSRWRDQVDLVHEPELLGTGGSVLANRDWFGDGPFMVAHGDNLSLFNPHAFIERHHSRPILADITMMTFVTDNPSSCGIVETDEEGLVVAFHEKVTNPPGRMANGAVYIFEPEVMNFIASLNAKRLDLSTQVLPHFLGRMYTYPNTVYHRDIGTPESLRRAQADFPAVGQPDGVGPCLRIPTASTATS